MENIKISQKTTYFIIVKIIEETMDEWYFGGFYNNTMNPGTINESQEYGLEDWFESIDEALKFNTYQEAYSYCMNIKRYDDEDEILKIVLIGWNDVKNLCETNWYQLKDFSV